MKITAEDVSRYYNGRSAHLEGDAHYLWFSDCKEGHDKIRSWCNPCHIGHWVRLTEKDEANVLRSKVKRAAKQSAVKDACIS